MMRLTRRETSRVELEKIRLPLVAMIDVILFLLFYFIIAGNLAAEEAALSTTLGSAQGRSTSALQPQILEIEGREGGWQYRMGERVMASREELAGVLDRLPREAGIIVRPSAAVPVAATAEAVQVAKDAGFTRISYVVAGT
jgi:biopolymer transport protein ExbD